MLDWLNSALSRQLLYKIIKDLSRLFEAAEQAHPDDLKDKLYYEQRLGNMLNAFTASRLYAMEQARPLIDEDIIDFVNRIPRNLRENKHILRETFRRHLPELHALPYSTRDVIPGPDAFNKVISRDSQTRKFIETQLTAGLDPRLASMLDLNRFHASLKALLDGYSLPPTSGNIVSRIPGLWRFVKPPENRVHPLTAALRLLQLNLYLSDK